LDAPSVSQLLPVAGATAHPGVLHNIDYHVAFDGNFYSVSYTWVQQVVEVRSTPTTVDARDDTA
jgi:hypothetical protein